MKNITKIKRLSASLKRVVALALFTALALLWAIVAWNYQLSEKQGLESVRLETAGLAMLFANQTTTTFRSVDHALLDLRDTYVNRPADVANNLKSYSDLLTDSILQVAIIKADGYLIYSNLGMPTAPMFLGDREHFKVHQGGLQDQLYVSRPLKGKVSGQWSIQLSRPIYRKTQFLGVVVISVDPDYFMKFYQEAELGKDGSGCMIRDTGEVMARSSGQKLFIGQVINPSPFADPGAPLQGSFHRQSQLDGVDRLSSYYRLPQYGLTVVIGPSLTERLAPLRSYQRQILFAASGVSLLLLLLAWQMLRNMARMGDAQRALVELNEVVHQSEQRFRSFVENAKDIVFELSPEGIVLYVSPNWTGVSGHDVGEAVGQPFAPFVHPDDAAACVAFLQKVIETGQKQSYVEFRVRHKDGSWNWNASSGSPLFDAAGKVRSFLGIAVDITERKQAEACIKHMAQHDGLTGLANRALFTDRLQSALASARRDKTGLALMFVDLDKFKTTNDQLGHAVGDLLLHEVAQRMLACIRDSDTVARVGGDEFMILLRNVIDAPDALAVAEKIRASIEKPFVVADHTLDISCSIGVALYPQHGEDDQTLSKKADLAMYQAKDKGRNRTVLYQEKTL